jgi:hypothetical protein
VQRRGRSNGRVLAKRLTGLDLHSISPRLSWTISYKGFMCSSPAELPHTQPVSPFCGGRIGPDLIAVQAQAGAGFSWEPRRLSSISW